MKKSALLLALAIVGCGHEQSARSSLAAPGTLVAPANRPPASSATPGDAAPASTPSAQHVVSERCNGQASSPSQHTVVIDGEPVQQPCGLVALEFQAAAFKRFAVEDCQESAESASVDCYRRWYGAFISRVLQRYTYADLRSFPFWCEAHATECDDLQAAEIWFLNSHSLGLRAAYTDSEPTRSAQAR